MNRQEPAAVEAGDPAGRTGDEALRLSEARLSNAEQIASLGSWEWDIASNKLAWSDEYSVIEAANGEDAIERFTENRDRVQMLILDVIMPRKNGKEAYTAIARLRPGIKALFISGYSNNIIDPVLLRGPGCHFIAKPVAPPALLNKVRDILDGR